MEFRRWIVMGMITILALGVMGESLHAGTVEVKNADKLTISGYTQGRFEFRDEDDDAVVNSSFFIRRSRVTLAADINDYTWANLQVDFASSKIVKDAFIGLKPADQLTLQLGQFKKPMSQEELFSSSGTPVIDRGLTNELTTDELGFTGRDQGLMLSAKDKRDMVQGWIGVFSGAGEANVSSGDDIGEPQSLNQNRGKDFAARLAVKPIPTIQLAANASVKSVGASYSDSLATHSSETFTAFGGDVKIEPANGLTLWGELLTGDNFTGFDDTLSSFEAATFLGFHVAGNYNHALSNGAVLTAIQPEARFEMFDPDTDTDDDGSSLVTAGVSLFFGKNVRWRNNVVIQSFQASGADSETRFVSELQGKL